MSTLIVGWLESSLASSLILLAKATLLLALAGAASLLLRRRSAAARHLVWTLAVAMLLVLPLAARSLPGWRIPIVVESALPTGAASIEARAATSSPINADATAALPAEPAAQVDVARARQGSGQSSSWLWLISPPGLLLVWAMGAAAVLAWLLLGRVALRFVLRRAVPLEGAGWDGPRRDAAWLLDVDRPVRVYRSRSAAVPVTWGVVRPVVVLPEEAESWPEDRRRVVLLHELSHVARRDCLTQLVAGLACAIYWFHPGVWYAARRMRVEREHACDDLVLSLGTPPPDYAAHLLDLARRFRSGFPAPLVALPMARPNQLEGRLLTVLAGPSARRPPTARAVAAAAAAMLLLTLPLSALQPATAVASAPAALPTGDDAPEPSPHTVAAVETPPSISGAVTAAPDSVVQRTLAARAGETLTLDLRTGGNVEITSWDEDQVHVRARLAGRDWRRSATAIERVADGVRVVAWQERDPAPHSTSHTFEIRVPRRFDVRIESAGGDVVIRDVAGRFSGYTGGGNVVLTRLGGEAQLNTAGGTIVVSDSDLRGRVATGGGEVLLRNVRGGLTGSSGSGQVTVEAQDAPRAERARAGSNVTVDGDSIARIVRRFSSTDAAYAITTRDGRAALLLRDTTLVLQLTDRGLDEIGTGDFGSGEERGFLSSLLGGMLRGGLRVLLDHAIEYSLADLHEARYENGRLVLESRRGNDVFENTDVNGRNIMADFDARDARTFAARANAARARLRR